MKKKIGSNISSGAEKVERVEKAPAEQARAEAKETKRERTSAV